MLLTRRDRTLALCVLASILLLVSGVGTVSAEGEPPAPSVSLSGGGDVLIGEVASLTCSFTNASINPDGVGYGPFVDVILPVNGADGATGTKVPDGLSFLSATVMGIPTTPVVLIFDEFGRTEHPLTGEMVVGIPGDQLVVFELPFGSYVPDQPETDIVLQAQLSELADLDATLYVRSRAGFYLGADPLANPDSDAPIVSSWSSPGLSVDPAIMTIQKRYIGPESETATGPNWVRQYQITVDIADDQPVYGVNLTDVLPSELAYLSLDSVSPAGYATADEPLLAVPALSPTSTLSLTWDVVTGTASASDITARFSFFVPEFDANGNAILDPLVGGCKVISNQATVEGVWDPIDERDAQTALTRVSGEHEADFEACALVIQKHVSIATDLSGEGATPGDTLEYTYDIQASDYFTVGGSVSFVITDTLSDGQLFEFDGVNGVDASFSFGDRDGVVNGVFTDGVHLDVDTSLNPLYGTGGTCGGGQTILRFDPGAALLAEGMVQPEALLTGGAIGQSGDSSVAPAYPAPFAPAQGSLVYRTVIQERYACPVPSGDQSVDHNDYLTNDVDIIGGVFNGTPSVQTGVTGDDSDAHVRITDGSICKSVYARNGVIGDTGPFEAGDTITYRIEYCTPTADVENVRLVDYLPLPTLRVDDWNADNVAGDAASWVFDAVVLTDSVPAPGHAAYGPDDTFHTVVGGNPSPAPRPVLSADASGNSLTFYYGHHDVDGGASVTKDLLFTIVLQDDPFADGMYLTNQLQVLEQNSFLDPVTATSIVQIELFGPELVLHKGVVWATQGALNPVMAAPVDMSGAPCPVFAAPITSFGLSSMPVDSNVVGVDGGDTVRYAIVIENLGTGPTGAYDVRLRDVLPVGLSATDVQNVCVTDGNGVLLDYIQLGSGLFDPTGGIELVDGAGTGALAVFGEDAATNVAVITYDVILPDSVTGDSLYTNTASLTNYANTEGGEDYITKYGSIEDSASMETKAPIVSKGLVSTSEAHSDNGDVVIGEVVTYQTTVTVPEGTTSEAVVIDTLEAGLAFVQILSITPSATITTDVAGGWTGVIAGAALDDVGTGDVNVDRKLTIPLGTLVNTDTDDRVDETIVVRYEAVVLNSAANVRGALLENNARFDWTTGSDAATPVSVSVVEPQLTVSKSMSPSAPDAGDDVLVTLTVANSSALSQVDAFDVTLVDAVPAGLTFAGFADSTGLLPDALSEVGGTISASWSDFALNASAAIAFTATVDADVSAGQTILNEADIEWASKCADPQAGANMLGVRRTGNTLDAGGVANNYAAANSDSVSIPASITKTLVSTSETETPASTVAIGEIVRYRLVATIPEGISNDLVLRDRLPEGMRFLDDGTAMAAIIADGTMSSGLVDSLMVSDIYTAGSSVVVPSVILPDAMVSSSLSDTVPDSYGSGTDIYVHFGTITNTDRDENHEYIVFEFNALVLNESAVQESATLPNRGRLYVDEDTIADSGVVNVTVVEPVLTIDKQLVTSAPYDAGDELVYEIVVTNVSAAGSGRISHDLVVTDSLDSDTTLVSALMSGGEPVTDMGSYVQAVVTELAPGEAFTLSVTVQVNDNVAPETALSDNARVTWTSLAGNGTAVNPTGSIVPGLSGAADGERNGSGGVNDYTNTDGVSVAVENIAAVKTLISTTLLDTLGNNVAIGEIATFEIQVVVPEGEMNSMTISDAVPDGLSLDPTSVLVNFGSSVVAADTVVSGGGTSGADLLVVLTDLTVSANNLPDDNLVTVTYQAHVVDVPENAGQTLAGQTTLLNGASVRVDSGTPVGSGSVALAIVEPRLEIVKTMAPDPVAIGDTVVMTVTASNTGLASAYDIQIVDVLEGTYLENWVLGDISAGASSTLVPVGGNLLLTVTQGELEAGSSMTFVATATVKDGVPYQTVIGNSATVAQATTLPGDDDRERSEPPTGDSASITVGRPDISISKTDNVSVTAPDDTLTYVLTVSNEGEVRATNVTVTDTLPMLTSYVGGSATDGGVYDVSSHELVWNVALLEPGQSQTLTYQALMDAYVSEAAISITNTVVAADDGTRGEDPDPANNASQDIDSINATALAKVTKEAVTTGVVSPGDTISYLVGVRNIGDRQAVMRFADAIDDPDLMLVVGSVVSTQGVVVTGNTAGDTGVQVDLETVTPGQPVTITFDCVVADPITKTSARVVNQGLVSGDRVADALSDNPATPAEDDPTVVPIDAAPVLDVSKTDLLVDDLNGDGIVNPGDGLLYTIEIVNTGNMPAIDVVIVDDLIGSNMSYVPGSSVLTQGTVDETDPAMLEFAIGQIDAGNTVTATFAVTVDNPLPVATSSVANQALVSGSNAVGEPSDDPDTPEDDDATVTPVVTTPSLVSTKTAELVVDADGDLVISPGDTLRYTVSVTSTGDVNLSMMAITDVLDSNLELVVGSVTSTRGAVSEGNSAGDTHVKIVAPEFPEVGVPVVVTFDAVISNPLPEGVNSIINQAVVQSDELSDIPTDDPSTVLEGDPTETPVVAAPDIVVEKDDGVISATPGETITYTLTIDNVGNQVTSLTLYDAVDDPNLSLVVGSVNTTQGTVLMGNAAGDTSIAVDLGAVSPASDTVTVTCQVLIANPLPGGAELVANQAVVTGDGVEVMSDDPATPALGDETVTPVVSAPAIDALKSAVLAEDLDLNGVVSPGDILRYAIVTSNSGNASAMALTLQDMPDVNTALITGTVTTTMGTVITGNAALDNSVAVVVPELAGGQAFTVTYDVSVNYPLAEAITVTNQGLVDWTGASSPILTDDPDTPEADDPTCVSVDITPVLEVSKTDSLLLDANDDGTLNPGETVLYTITVSNQGFQPAANLVLTDTLDSGVILVTGTVTTTVGVVTSGNESDDTWVRVEFGELAGQSSATVAFQIMLPVDWPLDVMQVANQAVVVSDGGAPVLSDDPDTVDVDDPTITPVVAIPEIAAYKVDGLLIDTGLDGAISAGDMLRYTVSVANNGTGLARTVVFTDTLDPNTALVVGSVTTSRGTVASGNAPGDTDIVVALGDLEPGATVTVTFDAQIALELAPGTVLSNQGVVSGPDFDAERTDDPAGSGEDDPTETEVIPPTFVDLTSFIVTGVTGDSVSLKWTTGAEVDNQRFEVWRGSSTSFGGATKVGEVYAALNAMDGATYSWTDVSVPAGAWWYWLVDYNSSGDSTVHHGTARMAVVGGGTYLPIVIR